MRRGSTRTNLSQLRRFGRRHNDYMARARQTRLVFEKLKNGSSVLELWSQYNIPKSTLYTWRQKLRKDPNYTPLEPAWGIHRRVFEDKEEQAIAGHIREKFINKHVLFTDEDFREIIREAYAEKCRTREKVPNFSCSAGFVADFKRRHRFSSRRQHFKRRPTVDAQNLENWRQEISDLLRNRNLDFVFNCDETSWKLFPSGLQTWAETGSQNVSTYIRGDEKECLTVMATISPNGRKLPLLFIAQGKTEQVETTQLGEVGVHWKAHSPNGWMTSDIMQLYLMHLREECGDHPVDLILDLHASHRCKQTIELARALDISLHFVPAGATDMLQPCDICIFGSLKSTARYLFRLRGARGSQERRTKRDAVTDMMAAWEGLKPETIEEGWECFFQGQKKSRTESSVQS